MRKIVILATVSWFVFAALGMMSYAYKLPRLEGNFWCWCGGVVSLFLAQEIYKSYKERNKTIVEPIVIKLED